MGEGAKTALEGAAFITADTARDAAIRFYRDVELLEPRENVVSAVLHATAHGVYEARIDGRPVSGAVLNPGWTSYEWRLNVQRNDVTSLLTSASSPTMHVDLVLGNGWFRGDLGYGGAHANYGEEIAVCAALQILFRDGATQRIVTSPVWSAALSDVTRNSLYGGETIDARLRGASTESLPAHAVEVDRRTLTEQISPPVVRHEVVKPQKIWSSPAGKLLVDFGQNLVGWTRLRVQGRAGQKVTIRHAEVLENGELGLRPLREATATDVFILSGGIDEFEPTFTFHGFRYASVEGLASQVAADCLEAVVVHSAMRRTGRFECSDDAINQLVHNSVWGQKGNFLSVPTDCPQRDERLGWTGDIAAYAASASFQFDTSSFLSNWLADLHAEVEHSPKSVVPEVVPDVLKYAGPKVSAPREEIGATAVWGDAAVWVPQALWRAYGDRAALAKQYPAMVLHLESVERVLSPSGLWEAGFQFGDWLDPDAPPDDPAGAKADPSVVAAACLYRSAHFATRAAAELGYPDDVARWAALAARVRTVFNEHYVHDGIVKSDCATVYALAIHFGLLDDTLREGAGRRLAELCKEHGYRITTGFAGTPFVTWALSETGHLDDAYHMVLEKECPSWLYPVSMGATTIWERWDSMLPDGSINPGEMTSFNHYALGAVVDWLYQVVGGIRAAAPGYSRVRIEPRPGPGISWARSSYESPAGVIEASWRDDDGLFVLDVGLPDGVPGEIVLPDGVAQNVIGGRHRFEVTL